MKLVLIEWLDSHSSAGGWKRLGEIEAACEPALCRSVGWLLRSTKGHKTLVPHLSGEQDGYVPYGKGDITIPNKAIVKMRVLAKAG